METNATETKGRLPEYKSIKKCYEALKQMDEQTGISI